MFELSSNLVTSSLAQWRGTRVRSNREDTGQLVHLYDMEGCPFCRLVREALTELNLNAVIYPCPKGGSRFRNRALELGGKARFPFLVDPNRQEMLYESTAIVNYLHRHYGSGSEPFGDRRNLLAKARSFAASASRLGKGLYVKPAKRPERMLELYSFEASPFSRPVRELLCELEIPYVIRNCGKSSAKDFLLPQLRDRLPIKYQPVTANRRSLLDEAGRVAIPYLVDPNTDVRLFESSAIRSYLIHQYQI